MQQKWTLIIYIEKIWIDHLRFYLRKVVKKQIKYKVSRRVMIKIRIKIDETKTGNLGRKAMKLKAGSL